MRNKLFMSLFLALAVSVPMWAQSSSTDQSQPSNNAPAQGWRGHRRMPNADQQLKHMTKMLNLTEDQQAKIKPILEDRQQKFSTLMQDSSLSRDDRRAKFQEIATASQQQVRANLTPDQLKTMDEMRAKRQARWQQKQGESTAPQQQQQN